MADQDRFVRVLAIVSRGLGRLGRDLARTGEVTPQQAETLQIIAEQGAMSTSTIASALGIDPSTASRNLAGLERGGFITRKKDTDDARQTDVRLTPRGRRTVDMIAAESQKVVLDLLERVPKNDRQRVTETLELFAKAVDGEKALL